MEPRLGLSTSKTYPTHFKDRPFAPFMGRLQQMTKGFFSVAVLMKMETQREGELVSDTMSDILRERVDWGWFFSVVEAIGDGLDDRKSRFDKSDLLEQALEEVTDDGSIQWVDKIGWDHEITH
tara:strand:+ start:258 stop:626 length:369 start_codon:yes stop_codon:yes gene_type:complete